MTKATLFDIDPLPTGPQSRTPAAPIAQRQGLAHAEREHQGVQAIVAALLWEARPGGLTIQELAEAVSRRRGPTKETTITQPLKNLRESGHVRDSGETRMGNAGTRVTIWVHTGGKA